MALGVGWNSSKVQTSSSWDKLLKYHEQQRMTKLMRWSWVSNGKIGEIHPP
jgi:pyruvate dehydrogenase complex dehydrogenase (E1) component